MKMFKISIMLLIAFATMVGAVSAAPTRIASISDSNMNGPFRVAVDASGSLYVTEPQKNLVVIYSNEGKYSRSFRVTYPLGVAVDASGMIYVGSFTSDKTTGYQNSVEKYNPDLTHAGSLGIGKGEVGRPNDIASGPDGKIYVVDSVNNAVKGYDTAAGSAFAFSGSFKRPTAIAVSNIVGSQSEVFVIDFPLDATLGEVARIQVFDKNGQYRRSFGFPVGQSPYPVGIAVDSAGLLYMTATRLSYVTVLDPLTGAYAGAGTFKDPSKMMYTAQGIAISRNGLAYAASSGSDDGKGRVDVFALDGYVTMAVDPHSLTFAGKQYAGNPDAQTIVISNTSGTNGGTLNWSATADQSWIKLDAGQGSVAAGSAAGLPVRVDISSFGAGTYTGTISIDPGFGQKQTINVTVTVASANVLNIGNGWLNFTSKVGTTPVAQNITISVDNITAPLSWSVTSSAPSWLSIAPAAGTATPAAPSTQSSVSVNTAGIPAGSYTGYLTVSAPGAIGTDSKVTVNLTVTPSSRLSVQTNLASAAFTVSGPATYNGSGATWSVDNAPAGQYTVRFEPVAGYKKPVSQTKTLIADGTTSFTASYSSWQDLAAKKNIISAKGTAAVNDSRVNVFKPNGTAVAYDLVALETQSGANVAVGDVDGDGSADLIVGAGLTADNPALVRVFRVADKSLITSFTPFGSLNGVKVAAGDLNGDGKAEVIVSTPANGGELAVYTFEDGRMVPTGITLSGAVLAATADTEGDGLPEIVTAKGVNVTIWKGDLTGGLGSWSATAVKQHKLPRPALSLAAADVNGDGNDEIIIGKSGTVDRGSWVVVIHADDTRTRFKAFQRFNVNVAAADLDGDGIPEILAGKTTPIAGSQSDEQITVIRVYSATGILKYTFQPFDNLYGGINIAVGDLGL